MIRKWLRRHWWFNETLKILVSIGFAFFAYACYIVSVESGHPGPAFAGGLIASISLMCVIDASVVLYKKIRGFEIYKD